MEDKKITTIDEGRNAEELEEIAEYLKDELGKEEIPDSLLPEAMKKRLEEAQLRKARTKRIKRLAGILATAACMGILVTAGLHMKNFGNSVGMAGEEIASTTEGTTEGEAVEEGLEEMKDSQAVYDRIYDAMDKSWAESFNFNGVMGIEEAAPEEAVTEGSADMGGTDASSTDIVVEDASEEKEAADSVYRGDYGETNVQVEFVDEGDIVKNDGRYLYQLVQDMEGKYGNYGYTKLQIVDTKGGLKEVSKISGFSNISEFYIYEDTAVIIESLWATSEGEEPIVYYGTEDVAEKEIAISDELYGNTAFSKIHMYDISDREKPKEIHSFTIKGNYKTSRISDGYFYFFTGYDTVRPKSRDDLEKYIPVVDGKVLDGASLYLPENTDATSYLVMLSIDMSNPTAFTDKMAAVTWGNYYYVSGKNIYVLDNQWAEQKEGLQCDKTRIMKFSYEKGQIEPVCEGTVEGTLLDQFAMDEYDGYFRLITTVNPYKLEKVTDDVTGEELGYYNYESMPESNSVYVLDEKLKVAGSIENLAEEERVYSARFMGNTGYFVTFRQTDPLFSVDFSNPKEPKILGELKISGFSEYLHFYGENLLLGIGYEADEDTGRTEGIKLSVFDISDPSNVKELNKLVTDYEWSDALHNHHAVLVSAGKNLIGFMAEDYDTEMIREYATYSYDKKKGFQQKFTVDCSPTEENNYRFYDGRGTYIGDTFYLLLQDGSVKAYDLDSGKKLEELEGYEGSSDAESSVTE